MHRLVSSDAESLESIKGALGKSTDPIALKARDMIAFNAGAAIYAADMCGSLADGVRLAQDAIGSGLALAKMNELASFSNVFENTSS